MSQSGSTDDAYLLDSHVLLWWWFLPERLSSGVLALLQNPASRLWVSSTTVWELSIKHHSGKLPEMADAHALRAGAFLLPHRDPFDRMLAFPCRTFW